MTNGTALAEIRTLMELLAKPEICTRGWSVGDGVLQVGWCLGSLEGYAWPDSPSQSPQIPPW